MSQPPSPHLITQQPPASHPYESSKRSPVHPEDVHFSRLWFAITAIGSAISLASIVWFGIPAAAVCVAAGALMLAYVTLIEPRLTVLERVTISVPDLPPALDGLRIGQIADSHLGLRYTADNLRWATAQMQREKPDLLVFTGDFVHRPSAVPQVPDLLRGLSAPLGMFAVPGNHDYWEGLDELRAGLASVGITLMMNQSQPLPHSSADVWILGTDDIWDGTPDLPMALQGVPADAFKILLAHTPHGAPEAARYGIGLQLSGHTHGGHMRLPLLREFALPRYTDSFIAGQYQVGRMALYVSRGLGGVPIRLNCRPEATILTLRRA